MKLLSLGVIAALLPLGVHGAAVRTLPGLTSIDFIEATSGTTTFNFLPNGSQLTVELTAPFGAGNRDFEGLSNEPYDVFYSDAAGNFDLNGAYITVRGTYNATSSSGFNLAAVVLRFGSSTTELANTLTAFTAASTAYVTGSELLVVDSSLVTASALGRTTGNEVMSVTVGFASSTGSAVPEPSTFALGAAGILLGLWGRCRRS